MAAPIQFDRLLAALAAATTSSAPTPVPGGIGSSRSTLQSAVDPSRDRSRDLFIPQHLSQFFGLLQNHSKPAEPMSAIMPSFLKKWHTPLSSENICYHAESHDFGVKIQELLLSDSPIPTASKEKKLKGDFYIKNMEELASKLGFKLKLAPMQYMVRDFWIPVPGGFALPGCSENVKKAVERAVSLSLAQQSNSMFCSTHEYCSYAVGAVNNNLCEMRSDFESALQGLPSLPFYVEGGNHYQVFLNGEKKVMMGGDCLHIILNQLRLDKRFEDPSLSIEARAKEIGKNLTREEIEKVLPEMYSQGLLKETKGCSKGFISSKEISSIITQVFFDSHILKRKDTPSGVYMKEAQKQKAFSPLDLNEQQIKASRGIVARYLAQIEATKMIIAQTFGVSVENVIFIPQADYHLDMFMRPGPNGSFFVQNYQCTYELLKLIESKAAQLHLSPLELEILKRYQQTAQTLERELKPLLQSACEKLTAAGFKVIPTPGVFYDATPIAVKPEDPLKALTFNVNFMNAITGYSAKTGRYYYITGGAEAGPGRLGFVLMEAYGEFLKSYGNIDLYPVGENPDIPGDFKESRRWINTMGWQFGIHCFATELKTASHSTQT